MCYTQHTSKCRISWNDEWLNIEFALMNRLQSSIVYAPTVTVITHRIVTHSIELIYKQVEDK